MVTAILTIVAALSLTGILLLIFGVRCAPVGFEDATGFHLVEAASPQLVPVRVAPVRAN